MKIGKEGWRDGRRDREREGRKKEISKMKTNTPNFQVSNENHLSYKNQKHLKQNEKTVDVNI